MRLFAKVIFVLLSCVYGLSLAAQKTYTNPLLDSGPDPWVTFQDGYYYYTNTTGHNITLWKTTNVTDLKNAEKKVVWTPPDGKAYSKELWAPEIHFLKGKWYVYFSADSGNNVDHRLYVLENDSPDPLTGTWNFKGKLTTPGDKWSIDGSVFENKGTLYLIWSGWKEDVNGEQDIYISQMKDPWTIEGERVLISAPTFGWERIGDLNNPNDVPHLDVNEGPEILKHGDKLYLIYSASACWTDSYALGMLTANVDADLLDTSSWIKSNEPVFTQSSENGVYGPGHNSFFKSPDGKEDYILYHANSEPGQGCGNHRSPRAQKFTWNNDGSPNFGEPLPTSQELPVPSGTK